MMETRRAEAGLGNPDAALQLRDVFLKHISLPAHSVVASYSAIGHEMNSAPLAEALRRTGCGISLPFITGKGRPLRFHTYEPGDRLVINRSGIAEPDATAPVVEPDVFLVPLLAFDAQGYRLGYGGGYYDRTLADARHKRKILAIGIGFTCQEITAVPVTVYDAKLDKIVTETGVF